MLAPAGIHRQSGRMRPEREALLVTGIYGSGKTSLVEEIADRFERLGVAFGAIDLDWLGWYHLTEGSAAAAPPDLQRENLSDVAGRYWRSDVQYLLIAGAARDDAAVQNVRSALPCPLRVVRLATPITVVEQRLTQVPTSGRAHDLQVARDWVSKDLGRVSADLTLPGDAPLPTLADQVLTWLAWPRVR